VVAVVPVVVVVHAVQRDRHVRRGRVEGEEHGAEATGAENAE
jgi:hypothetical protein